RGVDRAQLGTGLIERRPGSETSKQLRHAVDTPGDHGRRQMVLASHDVRDDFGILRIRHTGLEHADDGRGPIVQAAETHRFPKNLRVFFESRRPEAIGQDNCASGVGTVVLWSDKAAKHRMKSHYLEVRAAYHPGLDLPRLA